MPGSNAYRQVDGFLDLARSIFCRLTEQIHDMAESLRTELGLPTLKVLWDKLLHSWRVMVLSSVAEGGCFSNGSLMLDLHASIHVHYGRTYLWAHAGAVCCAARLLLRATKAGHPAAQGQGWRKERPSRYSASQVLLSMALALLLFQGQMVSSKTSLTRCYRAAAARVCGPGGARRTGAGLHHPRAERPQRAPQGRRQRLHAADGAGAMKLQACTCSCALCMSKANPRWHTGAEGCWTGAGQVLDCCRP